MVLYHIRKEQDYQSATREAPEHTKLMEVRHTLRNNEQALAETQKEIKAFLNWMKRTELAKAGGVQWQPAYKKFIGLKSHSKKPERAQIKDASSALKKNNPDTSQPK